MGRISVAFALGFLVVACSNSSEFEEASFSRDHSRGIIHGVNVPESVRPETVKIQIGSGLCTAVFVEKDPPTILTASHCLNRLPTLASKSGGVTLGGVAARRACVPAGALGRVGAQDLAVVVFPQASVPVPALAAISDVEPRPGMEVLLVGYGRNDGRPNTLSPGAGPKRLGLNRILDIAESPGLIAGMIRLQGALFGNFSVEQILAKLDSVPNHGDSGGPLFLKLPTGTALIGLVSGGSVQNGGILALYTNLLSEKLESFLDKALDPDFLKRLSSKTVPSDYAQVCSVR